MRPSRWMTLALAVMMMAGSVEAAGRRGARNSLEEAQQRYQRGRELYAEGDFQAALVELQRAYELAPSYKLLYNIAQVQYQLQDYAGALKSFQRYLLEGQGELSPQRRDEVQREIDRLQVRVANLRIVVNKPGAEIMIDDVPVGTSPLSGLVSVSAGRRKVSASLAGHLPVSRVVDVAGRDTVEVVLELSSTSVAAPQPVAAQPAASPSAVTADEPSRVATPEPRGFPWVPWVATGGLAVASGVSAFMTLGASQDLQSKRTTFGVTRAELDEASGKTRSLALATDILTAATLVAGGISAYLTLAGPPEPEPSPRVQLGVGPGGVGLAGTF